MGGGAKAHETKGLAVMQHGQAQGPVANRPGAQQRGGLGIREHGRNRIGITSRDRHEFGIAARRVPAGRLEVGAEVFAPLLAMAAGPATGVDPGHAHPGADRHARDSLATRDHPTNHLMPQNRGKSHRWGAALDLVQFGVTDPAGQHLDQQVIIPDDRYWHLRETQGLGVVGQVDTGVQHHRLHEGFIAIGRTAWVDRVFLSPHRGAAF